MKTSERWQIERLMTRETYTPRDVAAWSKLCGFANEVEARHALHITAMTWLKFRRDGVKQRSGYRTVLAMRYLLRERRHDVH